MAIKKLCIYTCFAASSLTLSQTILAQQPFVAQPATHLERIDQMQRELDQLRLETSDEGPMQTASFQSQSPQPAIAAMNSAGDMATKDLQPPKSPDKKLPDYKLTGVFQVDSAYFGQSDEHRALVGDIQDGAGFRRARLSATGNVAENASYTMEFDFAQSQNRFVDVWGQVSKTPVGNFRVGRFRQPFGMAELTSVRELPFLERPISFALAPFRQTGIMVFDTAFDEEMTYAFSGFRAQSDTFGNIYGDNGGYGVAERITFLPIDRGDCQLVHIGLAHSFLDPARDQLQFASQDEVFIGQNPNFGPNNLSVLPIVNTPAQVNTGAFNVQNTNLFNAELAASRGNILVQGEYRYDNLNLLTGENVTVHGGYAHVRWVLTGEAIPYNRTGGVFGRVKPDHPLSFSKCDYGAFEVAAQISMLDTNPLFGQAGVPGVTRRLNSTSLALNWYVYANAKAQFELINASLNDPASGLNGVANTAASRVQFDF